MDRLSMKTRSHSCQRAKAVSHEVNNPAGFDRAQPYIKLVDLATQRPSSVECETEGFKLKIHRKDLSSVNYMNILPQDQYI